MVPPTLARLSIAALVGLAFVQGCRERVIVDVGRPTVASVTITAPADTSLWPGGSLQLGAVVRDPLGRTLTDRSVLWSTTDPSIATVDQSGKVRGLKLGWITISASCEGATATLGLAIVLAPVGSVTVAAPAGTTLREKNSVQLVATLRDSLGTVLTGRPITWSSSDTAVAVATSWGAVNGVAPGTVIITATSEGESGTLSLTVLPEVAASVTVSTSGLGILYVPGGTTQASATVRDSAGRVLTRHVVTWSSSNPTVAEVDQTGLVAARAVGHVDITATDIQTSGSASISVLATPVADWSGAAEWVTFQGNASHSGYVHATLNPRVFRLLWVATVLSGTPLNPVTAGNGSVFVSNAAYFGANQILAALDATSGAELWRHDFGPIHGVHPPAVGNGRVYVTTSGQTDSYLYALDAATGSVAFRSPYGNQWERYYAPVVDSGWVYMAGGTYGGMYRFDATTGTTSWFVSTNQYDQWTPAVRDGLVYAYTGSYSPKVAAVSAGTGAPTFEIADSDFVWNGWTMNTAPVLGSSSDLFATQGNRLMAFDLAQHTVKWHLRDGFVGTVTVAGGILYVINQGKVEARDEAAGTLSWSWTPPGETATGTLIATDNLLFVSTAAHTYALDLAAHGAVWSYPAGGYLALSNQGKLFIAEGDGHLVAIAAQ